MKNPYRVPQKKWRLWNAEAKRTFNAMYELMLDQPIFLHPKAEKQPARYWKTTAWNAAWSAAEFAHGAKTLKVVEQ